MNMTGRVPIIPCLERILIHELINQRIKSSEDFNRDSSVVHERAHRGFASSPQTLNETKNRLIKKPKKWDSPGVQKGDLLVTLTES